MTAPLRPLAALVGGLVTALPAFAITLPPGYQETIVMTAVVDPVDFDWDSDGGLWVATKLGQVWVKRGATETLALTLPVQTLGDSGINGIRIDPKYASNRRVWIHYAHQGAGQLRLSHFTNSAGDTLSDEVVVIAHPQASVSFCGGCIRFHEDGTLFVSWGMDGDPGQAQDPHGIRGKILRIRTNGTVPPDNPYASGLDGDPRVWSSGTRLIYRCSLQPGTGELFIADVGGTQYDEISIAAPGGDFGWPTVEGPSPAGQPGLIYPLYSHVHAPLPQTSAIIGGDFAQVTDFGGADAGAYFFGDYNRQKLYKMTLNSANQLLAVGEWASGVPGPVSINFGPDGHLYYAAHDADSIRRIEFTGGPGSRGRVAGLTVARGLGGEVVLDWGPSCQSGDDDYSVFSGRIRDWEQWEPVTCTTLGARHHVIENPGPESTFYLVAPHDGIAQGSYGLDGDGVERVPLRVQCLTQQLQACP